MAPYTNHLLPGWGVGGAVLLRQQGLLPEILEALAIPLAPPLVAVHFGLLTLDLLGWAHFPSSAPPQKAVHR